MDKRSTKQKILAEALELFLMQGFSVQPFCKQTRNFGKLDAEDYKTI